MQLLVLLVLGGEGHVAGVLRRSFLLQGVQLRSQDLDQLLDLAIVPCVGGGHGGRTLL